MKICIIQGAFNPIPDVNGGAVEKRWYKMALEFTKKGHKVFYISKQFTKYKNYEFSNGIIHKRVKGFESVKSMILTKFFDLIYSFRACKAVPEGSDIVISNTFFSPVLLNYSLKKKNYINVNRVPKGQMFLYKKSARIQGCSKHIVNKIKSELNKNDWNIVKYIPNPLPFSPNKKIIKNINNKTILYTGRINSEKGLEILINSMKYIKKKWTLKIIGPYKIDQGGSGQNYLKKLKLLSKNLPIKFIGPIFDIRSLAKEYIKATIFVYPSIAEKGEAFGLAPLEAMSYGCIPVVSDLNCFKDFIKNKKNGLVFNHKKFPEIKLAKAITTLQNSKKLLKVYSKNSLKVNTSYSPEYISSLFINDFKKIINRNKKIKDH
jgi:glycosyltransferase involved in cell wall biosynthesis